MRLNQFLASAGCGSRRSCEALILEGRVTVNGREVRNLATRVSSEDAVLLDRKPLARKSPTTLAFNKPCGYLCTAKDPEQRKTIYHLLPKTYSNLKYVGRLDKESEGLLILTNDGDLAHQITHPATQVEKVYEVLLNREFDFSFADKLRKGMWVEGKRARFQAIHSLGGKKLKVVLTQGIKRQIRILFSYLGYEVAQLKRVSIGKLELRNLRPGEFRVLGKAEIERLIS